jgi:serine protease Do
MQPRIASWALFTKAALALGIVSLFLAIDVTGAQPSSRRAPTKRGVRQTPAQASPQPFEDIPAISQRFADELGRLKEQNETVSPAELAKQADVENTYKVSPAADPGKNLDAKTIYSQAKPGVVIVGGLYKCDKCSKWHVRCASGFVAAADGLILTNHHAVEAYKGLAAMGVMTDDGRVFPVKAVLASSKLNDLALLKVDAEDLHPLPITENVSVADTVYCLSHPAFGSGTSHGFYAFTEGIVSGKFTLHTEKNLPLNVLAVTADYGPGSSGGPLLNEHGAVVSMVCQAIPLSKGDHEKGVQMVWRLTRPSCSILAMLSTTTSKRPPSSETPPEAPSKPEAAPAGEAHAAP